MLAKASHLVVRYHGLSEMEETLANLKNILGKKQICFINDGTDLWSQSN